jgi:hypothetical protein
VPLPVTVADPFVMETLPMRAEETKSPFAPVELVATVKVLSDTMLRSSEEALSNRESTAICDALTHLGGEELRYNFSEMRFKELLIAIRKPP